MKKTGLLNQPISNVIAGMGHLDALVLADAGLPIPSRTTRIDLAVSPGIPPLMDVLRAVLEELDVQAAVIAEEIGQVSPGMLQAITEQLKGVPLERLPHEEFKRRTEAARAVIRTGEFTPYANVILVAGVVF